MTTEFKRAIEGDVLGITVQTGYTVGPGLKFVIHNLSLTNYSMASDAKVSVYLVPEGKTATDAYKVGSSFHVLNRRTEVPKGAIGQVLDAGGSVQYISDTAAAVTAVCSGVEITA